MRIHELTTPHRDSTARTQRALPVLPVLGQDSITYDLRGGDGDTAQFQSALEAFTDRVMEHGLRLLSDALDIHTARIEEGRIERLRSEGEYVFDMLTLGMLWRVYGARAVELSQTRAAVLSRLYKLRRAHPQWKQRIDTVRAALAAQWLTTGRARTEAPPVPSLLDVDALIRWLDASGEFREECERLRLIRDTLAETAPARAAMHLHAMVECADWFDLESVHALGGATARVDAFVNGATSLYRGREDAIFVSRPRCEYHLAMVGAELMNRAFRASFRGADRRMVLLPACMRGEHADSCKARKEGLDLMCTGCAAECHVNKVRPLGREERFDVRLIPHSSDFSTWLRTRVAGTGTAVVGVACILNLIGGGLELRALDIPAQCVFLNSVGCQAHWHDKGLSTDIDHNRLRELLA